MSEINTPETVGQIDLFTNEVVETTPELTPESIVAELTDTLTDENTAYVVWKIVTGAFKVLGVEKNVPSQMMYNYTRNGMIVKGKKGSAKEIRYTKDEVKAFATKYVTKYAN